ncbi:MAG: ATP-binding cassette domain-containing protein, partial [Deltaproteobacteria bacterium]|nr:ATP-binding cassette domain-containing protein [Deltaproteobacteria bacterium]
MSAFLTLDGVSKVFRPNLTLGERIAAKLGSDVEQRPLRAVDNVSLTVAEGETLGLVGESGCGKSTLGRLAAGILPPDAGTVRLGGTPIMDGESKVTTRVQTVFQDPFA